MLSGEDEARLTFLACRRWFGWSAGRLAMFDIGGGSLEIAAGPDEAPEVAWSLPLGAARLARTWFAATPPDPDVVKQLRTEVRAEIARDAGHVLRGGRPDRAAASSKTFRSLARICGAAPSAEGRLVRRVLPATTLSEWIPKLAAMNDAEWPSCRASRRAAPTRSCPGRSWRRRSWTSSTSRSSRSAPGRCARG